MKKVKNTLYIILIIFTAIILVINLMILVKSFINKNEIPGLMGYKPFVVLSGSMETEIYTGDLAIVKEIETQKLQKDDVIAYKTGESVVVHRIVEITKQDEITKFKTKGDNNNVADSKLVEENQIEGKYLFKISKLGNFVMFLQEPFGMLIAISIPILIIILVQFSQNKQYKKELEKMQKETKENK